MFCLCIVHRPESRHAPPACVDTRSNPAEHGRVGLRQASKVQSPELIAWSWDDEVPCKLWYQLNAVTASRRQRHLACALQELQQQSLGSRALAMGGPAGGHGLLAARPLTELGLLLLRAQALRCCPGMACRYVGDTWPTKLR